jgi:hypothetical protein
MQPTVWFQPGTPLSDEPASPGDFYVIEHECMACGAPAMEAPALMAHRTSTSSCFFLKQPSTPDEVNQAVTAVQASCCGAVRYRGSDPSILARLSVESIDSSARVAHLIDIDRTSSLQFAANDIRPILTTPPAGFFTRLFKRFK